MVASYNVVLLVTDHDDFDIPTIVEHAAYVVDTRNMAKDITKDREKIYLLGSSEKKERIRMEH